MDTLLFDSENLKKGALSNLNGEINKLDIVLEGIKSKINSMEEVWSGDVAKEVLEHFKEIFKSLNALSEKSLSYAEFLGKAISGYGETDNPSSSTAKG